MRSVLVSSLVVALAVRPAPAAAQAPGDEALRGGVPSGPATSDVLSLTLDDAITRGLQYNLGLILGRERVGIAGVTTLLARHQQAHTSVLSSHIDPYSPQAQSLLEGLRAAFMARGADLATAAERARAALFGMVERQATMLSFTDIFRLLALLFLAVLPLIFLMKSPRAGGDAAAMH